MAANVATTAIMTIGTMDSRNTVNGTPTKSRRPAALLAMVCRKRHLLYITSANIWLMSLMRTIVAPQIQSQLGSAKAGISFMQQQATNAKSARLSSSAPVLLSQWSLLARNPSAISLNPQAKYITQKATPPTSKKRRQGAPRNRMTVMRFGRCFI